MITWAAISFFFKRAFYLVVDHWEIALGIVIAIMIVVVFHKACKPKPPKIDEEAIQRINKANEADRKAELQKVIEKNADTVTTVDQRTTIAQTNETTRNAEIFSKIQEADRKIAEAKRQGREVTGPELECMLNPTTENCKHCKQ